MFGKEFIKDFGARLARTAIQAFFLSVAFDKVPVFDEETANLAAGSIMFLASLVPTGISAFKASRANKAAKLLNKGQVTEAKVVAAGERVEMSGRAG